MYDPIVAITFAIGIVYFGKRPDTTTSSAKDSTFNAKHHNAMMGMADDSTSCFRIIKTRGWHLVVTIRKSKTAEDVSTAFWIVRGEDYGRHHKADITGGHQWERDMGFHRRYAPLDVGKVPNHRHQSDGSVSGKVKKSPLP
jgi:hypothetical protein